MRKTLTVTAIALLAGTAGVALAQDRSSGATPSFQQAHWRGDGESGKGWHHRRGHHDGKGGGRWGRGDGPRDHHRGPHRGMMRQMETFDVNGDGAVTQAEIEEVRETRLTEFDADGNGTLSIEEYQALWLDGMRERMVDDFQAYDNDGDGQVTAEEFTERFAGLVERFDRNGDGELSADDRRGPRMRRGAPPATNNAPAATETAPAQPAPQE